jgi:hypothetical protein
VGFGELIFRFPSRKLSVEMAGSPRFLGNPCVPMPCSRTPVGPRTPGHYGASTWPPLVSTTEAPATTSISGLNRTALGLAVYASQRRLPDTTQDSLPAARPSLAGRDWLPAELLRKVSEFESHPPFPSFPGAMTPRSPAVIKSSSIIVITLNFRRPLTFIGTSVLGNLLVDV